MSQPFGRPGTPSYGYDPFVQHCTVECDHRCYRSYCQPLARTGTAPQGCRRGVLPSAVVFGRIFPHIYVSTLLTQILYHRGVALLYYHVQCCSVTNILGLLVSSLLARVLHHRQVTIVCCRMQWCMPEIPPASKSSCVLSTIAFTTCSSPCLHT